MRASSRLRFDDFDVVGAIVRPALVAQQFPGKDHVVRRHRLAVGKARRRIDREGDEAARRVGRDAFGEQAVQRERLVIAAREQALDHVAADIGGGQALDDERIEAVEGAEHALHQLAAFGRRRIGIGRMAEVRAPGRLAMHGDGVSARLPHARRPEPMPEAANSAPSMTVRRDARHCISAGNARVGAAEVRMRFVPVLREFITGLRLPRPAAFSAHSWLYCRREFGYQAAVRRHAPAAFHTERAGCKASFGGPWAANGRTRDNCNESSDCIGPAVGPGADRHFAAGIGGSACGREPRARRSSHPKRPAQKPAPAQKQAPATQPRSSTRTTAGAAWPAAGRRRPAAADVFAVDEGLRQGPGHQQQAGLRHHQRRPAGKRHAGRHRAAVRAGRRPEGAARHGSARHAALRTARA